ncbi:gliding motility-associated C-terminal domain-containing protein [Pontibacter pamirensis]|uniref:gliding motility-associated C-terminal domain-containing protein n=1 Tax=Pontibacter pamirensis TaxID=2562824 RepID=UPI00138A4D4F|nr:gliding motility-associated C-terminal domain-containing protein [Pontibacter pamirensis]
MIPRLVLLLLILFLSSQAFASHIVGGEFDLRHVSDYNYRLSFNLYFDEINGEKTARDKNINVTIFEKGTNRTIEVLRLPLREESLLNYSNIGCTTSGLETSKLLYYQGLYLDPAIYNNPAGYYVSWERCCRNSTISSIQSPQNTGTTVYMEFPAVVRNGAFFKNSSPKLSLPPSDYACQGELFYYDFGSVDPDGDQLVYDMVSPLKGYSSTDNLRPAASSAPYPEVNWLPGYSKDTQIHGDPAVNIDRNTGWLTVRPNYVGLFVFSVRCQEFRNGVKIGEVRRDFQLVVKACRFNNDPIVSVTQLGSPSPSTDGQVIRIDPTDPRCINISYTDPEINEPLTLDVKPVNFTNDNVFSLSGTTSGIANIPNGAKTLEATICFEQCFNTGDQPITLDLVVSDDGDDGCGLPRQTIKRISLIVETREGNPPALSLSTGTRVFEVERGDRIRFDVTGSDADQEEVTVSASGRGFQLNAHNISFESKRKNGRATSPFSWTIDQQALQQSSYFIDFLVTSTTSCGSTLTRTETIEVRPLRKDDIANNTILSDQTLCAGEAPATLIGSLPTGGSGSFDYTWEMSTTNDLTGFSLAPGPQNKAQHYTPPVLTEPTWFRRKVTSGWEDELISTAVKITVQDAIDNNTISSAQAICASTAPNLLTGPEPTGEVGTYTYQWEYSTTGPTSGFRAITETGKGKAKDYQPGILNQTTWYRRVITSAPCPPVISNAVEITVTPDISQNTIRGNQVVCVGITPGKLTGPVLTSSNDSFSYAWEYSTTSATAGFSPAPGLNTAADYTPGQLSQSTWYRRIVRTAAASCQSTSNAVLVTIEALPATPQATDVTICPGEMATLQGSAPAAGVMLQWYDKPAGGKLLHEGATYLTAPLHTTTDFYVQAMTTNGCASTSRTKVKVTIQDAIENNTISSAQSICANTAPALLSGPEPTGEVGTYTYQWEYSTTGPTSGFRAITETGKGKAKDYQPGILNQTTWYRRVITSAPCPPVRSNVVEITVTPDISQNTIKGNQLVCVGITPGKLTGPVLTSSNDSFSYAWEYSTTSATVGFSPAPGLNTAADYTPGQLSQSTWYRRLVRTAAASCQSTSNAVLVTIEALPATPQATDVTICPGEMATLQGSAPAAGVMLQWYDKLAGGKLLYEGATYQTAPLHSTTDFYVQAMTTNGCASTGRTKVTVTVRPSTANAGEDATIMEGQSVKLQATGGTSYSWSPATNITNPTIPDPAVRPSQTTTYTVTVTSEFGCTYTDEVTVNVLPHVVPTNAITVNGDNVNETWFIKNIEFYPNCQVQIFTRWGNKIYESKGYREPWNGTHNGMPLPMASYYYIIDLGMNEKPVAGSITLIK